MDEVNPNLPPPATEPKKFFANRKPLIIIGAALFLAGGVFAFSRMQNNQSEPPKQLLADEELRVIAKSPEGVVITDYNTLIRMTFNHPVTAHHAESFVDVIPAIPGQVSQGDNPSEIIFRPQEGFLPGSKVTVRLIAGLPSDNGKKLMQDFFFTFKVRVQGNSISFTKNGFAGKFMSFDASHGTDFNLEIGADVRAPKIKIYKAAPAVLLGNLVYTKANYYDNDPIYPSVYGTYQEKPIDTSKLTVVKELTAFENDDKINFKDTEGLYLFEALDGDTVVAHAWVSLSQIGIHFRQDDKKAYFAAQNLASGEPENGINLAFYTLDDAPKLITRHTLSGIQEYALPYPNRVDLVVAQKGSDVMIVPVTIPNSQAEIRVYRDLDAVNQIFLYTDRPIYRKGDVVKYRGIVRSDSDGIYTNTAPPGTKVYVFSTSYNGNEAIYPIDIATEVKDGGIFSGEFRVPDEASGYFSINASTNRDKKNYFSANFDVAEYIKPEYGINLQIVDKELIRGDKITAEISGVYFDGRSLAGETVKYTVYNRSYYETEKAVYNRSFKLNFWGGMCGGGFGDEYYGETIHTGEIRLDNNGKALIEYDTAKLKSTGNSYEITILAEKTDKNNNQITGAGNAVVHAGEFNIFFRPGNDRAKSGEEFTKIFYAEDLTGQKLGNRKFTYSLFQTNYNGGNYDRTVYKTGEVTTNDSGLGIVKERFETAEEYSYLDFAVSAKDGRANEIEGRSYISFYRSRPSYGNELGLRITSTVSNLTPGTDAVLEITAPADLNIFATFERGRVYDPQWLKLKRGANTFTFPVPDKYMPSITPTFSFFHNSAYYIEGLALNVPAMKKLVNVEIKTDKTSYKPGETAVVTIRTLDQNNRPVAANLGLGIVDKAIYALRKNATRPIHSSYYYFRGRNTNAASSMSWIYSFNNSDGRGGGGGGGDLLGKDADTLYWNPEIKTDASGETTIAVQLGNTETTWKITGYASTDDSKFGQGEFDFLVNNQ